MKSLVRFARAAVVKGLVASLPVGISLMASAGAVSGCKSDTVLKVTAIEPRTGDHAGGERITVRGNQFQAVRRNVKVFFGDQEGSNVQISGDNEFTVSSPPGKKGETVDLIFQFEPGGVLKVPKAFTFIEKKQAGVDDLKTTK